MELSQTEKCVTAASAFFRSEEDFDLTKVLRLRLNMGLQFLVRDFRDLQDVVLQAEP